MFEPSAPTALVNCRVSNDAQLATIDPNGEEGSRPLTRIVLRWGHRRLSFLGINPPLVGAELRLKELLNALRDAPVFTSGVKIEVGMASPICKETNRSSDAATEILSGPDAPAAIRCGIDEFAFQAYLAALASGLRIPEDVSVIGSEDFHLIARVESHANHCCIAVVRVKVSRIGPFGANCTRQACGR